MPRPAYRLPPRCPRRVGCRRTPIWRRSVPVATSRVGVDQNTYLWGYRDPATGQLTGFDIDMLKQVAQAIFGSSDPGDIRYRHCAER